MLPAICGTSTNSHSSPQLLWKGSHTSSEVYQCKQYMVEGGAGQQKGEESELDWVTRGESHLKAGDDQLLAESHRLGWLPGEQGSAELERGEGTTQL